MAAEIEKRRCKAQSKTTGNQCSRPAIPGGTVCHYHGGAAPAVKDAARRRVLEAKLGQEIQALGWEPVTDPVAAYANLAGEVLAFLDLARDQMNRLGSWDYTDSRLVQDARALVQVYERAVERAEKILSSMVQKGIDVAALRAARERPSREQAEQLAAVLRTVLADPRVTVAGDPSAIVLDALKQLEGK